jgi:hypothetical protein
MHVRCCSTGSMLTAQVRMLQTSSMNCICSLDEYNLAANSKISVTFTVQKV